MARRETIIKDTHRGLYYEDGVLTQVLGAGRHALPRHVNLGFYRTPRVEVVLVNVRERELTIKGQEILTADKVAIRVSIIVQFRVTDPKAAMHEVESFQERLYGDVQLAARRSLASMTLEEILTDRNRLSEDILRDVYKVAGNYGVTISRAEIKDLIFPGNLQEIMNKVLAAERTSQAQLVEAQDQGRRAADQRDGRGRGEARPVGVAGRLDPAQRRGRGGGHEDQGRRRGQRPPDPRAGRRRLYPSSRLAPPHRTRSPREPRRVGQRPDLHRLRQARPAPAAGTGAV